MKNTSKKGYIFCILLTISISTIVGLIFFKEEEFEIPDTVYQIYLDGEKIGLINDKEALYSLINDEQKEIKDTYNVDQVYPPNGFSIEKYTTYDSATTTVNDIYEKIKSEKDFTVKGYTITIKSKDKNDAPKYIHVLDKKVFDNSIYNFITTFVGEEKYLNYLNGTQEEIVDVGEIINNMYFDETLTIKDSYIGVDERIFTTEEELTRYLLYGDKAKEKKYIVKKGDTISSIAFANSLNEQEFLIANPAIRDVDTLLAVGQEVSIALIEPQMTLVYESEVTLDQEVAYETEQVPDYSKYIGYKKVVQEGITGINRITKQIQVRNGEENQGAFVDSSKVIVIRAAQNEIISVGKKYNYSSGNTIPIDTSVSWAWPTDPGYVITSPYGYRWGKLHEGIDISGTGHGSPIYSVLEGEVIIAQKGGWMGSSAGNNIVIRHSNGYYSVYAHLHTINVKVGDIVSRKQKIGTMGKTGKVTGTHLHLAIYAGYPYAGGKPIDPKRLYNFN